MESPSEKQLSESELKKSYWYVTHAAQIRQASLLIGCGVVVLIILFALVAFAGYLTYVATREAHIVKPLRSHAAHVYPVFSLNLPSVLTVGAIDRGGGYYDLYAQSENNHREWRADGEIVFTVAGSDLTPVPITLLPGERRYAFSFNVASADAPHISARLQNVAWRRLTRAEQDAIATRRHIRVSDMQVHGGRTSAGAVIAGTRAQFTLSNTSVYHLYDFRVAVLFKHAGTPVAAALVPVFSLERNTPTRLEALWIYSFASTDYEVIPEIDVLNDQHVKPAL